MNEVAVEIRSPGCEVEWHQYFRLRWEVLRKPWGEPEGSEKDSIENQTWHEAVIFNGRVVGVGRVQMNSSEEAQIRYMAVSPEFQGRGFGRSLVLALEKRAMEQNASYIRLDAREKAVDFYQALGYEIAGESYLLFDEIQHYSMKKLVKRED